MYHVIALEDGKITKIKSTDDQALAKMIADDYENATYVDDEDKEAYDKTIKWLQLRGLSYEEAEDVMRRRRREGRQAIKSRSGSLWGAIAQTLGQLSNSSNGDHASHGESPDLSGVIDRFNHRISREDCGPCFVCGEVAAMHKECMEPGGAKCCPAVMCEACDAAMAEADTAKAMAERYRSGPLNILATLSNLFREITGSGDADEFADWTSGILEGGPSLDVRLASPEYRPVMAALASALRDRAEMVEKLLRESAARKENDKS